MRCSALAILLWITTLCVAGCTQGICSRSSECAPGFVCSTYGTCVIPPDASVDGSDQTGTPTISADAATTSDDALTLPTDGDL
jgi:hypothetical protein